jgi:hypothetical protein
MAAKMSIVVFWIVTPCAIDQKSLCVSSAQLCIQNIDRCPPYPEAVSSIRNLRTYHKMAGKVTQVHMKLLCLLNLRYEYNVVIQLLFRIQFLRTEHRLRVFRNRVLRVFGPRGERVTGRRIKLQYEELHNYFTKYYDKSSIMRWARHVARIGIYIYINSFEEWEYNIRTSL